MQMNANQLTKIPVEKLSETLRFLIAENEIPLSDALKQVIDDVDAVCNKLLRDELAPAQHVIPERLGENLPCPFCGGEVDISGWRSSNGNSGPECNECGATACNLSDWNKRIAQPVIPIGLVQAINRLLDNDGSRGCFDALEQHRAKTELERLLAAAQQNEPQNIPAQLVRLAYKLPDERPADSSNGNDAEAWFDEGWNACRAEMLKTQQNEPQNIPENIPAQPVSEHKPYAWAIEHKVGLPTVVFNKPNTNSWAFKDAVIKELYEAPAQESE